MTSRGLCSQTRNEANKSLFFRSSSVSTSNILDRNFFKNYQKMIKNLYDKLFQNLRKSNHSSLYSMKLQVLFTRINSLEFYRFSSFQPSELLIRKNICHSSLLRRSCKKSIVQLKQLTTLNTRFEAIHLRILFDYILCLLTLLLSASQENITVSSIKYPNKSKHKTNYR